MTATNKVVIGTREYHPVMQQIAKEALQRLGGYIPRTMEGEGDTIECERIFPNKPYSYFNEYDYDNPYPFIQINVSLCPDCVIAVGSFLKKWYGVDANPYRIISDWNPPYECGHGHTGAYQNFYQDWIPYFPTVKSRKTTFKPVMIQARIKNPYNPIWYNDPTP